MKKLNIFGEKISVKVKKTSDPSHAGEFHPESKLILIHPEYENKMHTLAHEFVHAVWSRSGLNQTKTSHDVQEIVCENVATALVENFVALIEFYNKYEKKKKTNN